MTFNKLLAIALLGTVPALAQAGGCTLTDLDVGRSHSRETWTPLFPTADSSCSNLDTSLVSLASLTRVRFDRMVEQRAGIGSGYSNPGVPDVERDNLGERLSGYHMSATHDSAHGNESSGHNDYGFGNGGFGHGGHGHEGDWNDHAHGWGNGGWGHGHGHPHDGGPDPTPVPLPAGVWLLGSGLLAAVGMTRRRRSAMQM